MERQGQKSDPYSLAFLINSTPELHPSRTVSLLDLIRSYIQRVRHWRTSLMGRKLCLSLMFRTGIANYSICGQNKTGPLITMIYFQIGRMNTSTHAWAGERISETWLLKKGTHFLGPGKQSRPTKMGGRARGVRCSPCRWYSVLCRPRC